MNIMKQFYFSILLTFAFSFFGISQVVLPVDFESTTANYNVVGFGGVDVAVEANPDASGINTSNTVVRSTKTAGAEFWAGAEMSLDATIDFSTSEKISINTWSPKADIPVRLKLENASGGFVELDVNTTVTNQWETLTWNFTGQTAGMNFNKVVVFFEFVPGLGGDGSTYYYDNIEVVVPLSPSLPITLEEDINPTFQDFNGSNTQIITNPYQEGGNTSANVAQNIVPANEAFAGVSFSVQTIDLAQGKTFNLDVRTILPDAPILLKLENTLNGTSIERLVVVSEENQWENIIFDFGTEIDATYDKVTLFTYFNLPAPINRAAYWDNLEQNLNDLVELPVTFESATADYNVIGFEGADAAVEANPDPSGENTSDTVVRSTKTEGAQFFAGTAMTLDVPIDFSESESISIKTWSPKADIPVRLKLEGSAGEVLELDVNTTVENQWETLTWDFTGQTGEVEWLTVVLFFEFVVDLPGDGSTYYYDDIQVAAPEEELLELPVDFESTTIDYNLIGFEGAESAVVANPDPSGENTSDTVVETTKTEGAAFFAGTAMMLDVPIDFSESESISIKTWSPKADIPVRLKLEAADPAVFVELDVNTTVENQWETLTWDFTGQTAGIDFVNVVLFFEFVVDLPGDGSTYYYDDIQVADAPLSINDNLISSVVSYPNPVINTWNVQADKAITDIVIYNLFGQRIMSISPNMKNISLNMSEFKSGMYLAHIISQEGTKIIKVLKQ
ncbi:MAG: T9SS type A sorting domain-containing protein [Flavobacteriales bacterium]|nr:MAG: T9SS type A sorting domain-containing protein [Flavobacteriales bacterium]